MAVYACKRQFEGVSVGGNSAWHGINVQFKWQGRLKSSSKIFTLVVPLGAGICTAKYCFEHLVFQLMCIGLYSGHWPIYKGLHMAPVQKVSRFGGVGTCAGSGNAANLTNLTNWHAQHNCACLCCDQRRAFAIKALRRRRMRAHIQSA